MQRVDWNEPAALVAEPLQVPSAMSRLVVQRRERELQADFAFPSAAACCAPRPLKYSNGWQSQCHLPLAEPVTAFPRKQALKVLQAWNECKTSRERNPKQRRNRFT